MTKWVKFIGITAIIVLSVFVIALVSLVFFVNPNRFKPLMIEQVMKKTGRELILDGSLSWTLFPTLGIKTGHMVLKNPAGFSDPLFIEIKSATVGVRLMPLFHKKIESSGIVLDGMRLHLIRNTAGKNNWDFPKKSAISDSSDKKTNAIDTIDTKRRAALGLAVTGVTLDNAEIVWIDQQKKQSARIEHLSLQAKNISFLNPFPVTCSFDFNHPTAAIKGHLTLRTEMALDFQQAIFSFRNTELMFAVQQKKQKLNGTLTGNIIADLGQYTIQWPDLKMASGELVVTGKITATELSSSPHIVTHLQIQPLDLKNWLHSIGLSLDGVQTLKNFSGNMTLSVTQTGVNAKGQWAIDTLEANHIRLTHLIIPFQFQRNILDFSSISGNFYQGLLRANAKLNLASSVPQMALQARIDNMQVGALLRDLNSESRIQLAGIGHLDVNLVSAGTASDAIIRNLSGGAHISLHDGMIKGIDVAYLINTARALIKQQAPSVNDTHETPFGQATASLAIEHGMVTNPDLLIHSPQFVTDGKGTVDLVKKQIDYNLQIHITKTATDESNNIKNLYGLPIPIRVTGSLSNPSIRLNQDVLIKAITEQEIKKVQTRVQERIQERLQQRFNGQTPPRAGRLLNHFLGN